ncbi:MAG: ABC transporter substrate-binding protein [Nanoarchaeota archaeon]|nr:ABC transporter substrate-binding protein [Nanoarchaeota archaeon]MBU1322243.1 ABC transporter substrate-binding protein [Nanoarchaeota archaeon]MBU1598223.1 ABC transporter substrate-binding protein [Nanoarchaeota archaeon]
MKKINFVVLASLALLALLIAGCSQTPTGEVVKKEEVIKIGFIGPLTGDAAVVGIGEKNAVDIAVEEINNAGGIDGRPLQAIFEDGKCSGKEAATAAQKLINIDNVKIILGGACSSETLGAAPITEANKVILFSAFSSSPDITYAGDYVFRTTIPDTHPDLIGPLLHYIAENKRIAIITENSDYAIGIRKGLKEQLPSFNVDIVADERYASGEKDFRTYLTKIKSVNPDALFINVATSGNTPGLIIKQAAELGMDVKIYGNFLLFAPESVELVGDLLEGAKVFDAPLLDKSNPKADAFMEKYNSRYKEPFSFWDAGARYDTVYITKNALEECGEDTDCIRDYLYDMDWYLGTIGKYKFDKKGDVLGIKGAVKELVNREAVLVEYSEAVIR